MKRMRLQVAVTFFILFVIASIISGIYNVVSMKNFFTLQVIEEGIFAAIVYLIYLWLSTRRNKLKAYICFVIFGILLLLLIVAFSHWGVDNILSSWNWKNSVMIVYYTISFRIAEEQGKELLEEEM